MPAVPSTVDTHLDLLTALYWLWAAFNIVIALSMGASAAAAAALAGTGGIADVAAGVTAGAFLVVSVAALIWGVAHGVCARALGRRRPQGRMAALVLAVLNLVLFPLGTVLAAYAGWLLLQAEGRARFEPAHAAAGLG